MLSNAADRLFQGLLRMMHLPDKQIHEFVRDYFRESVAVALEQSRHWPDDPKFDIDAECVGLDEMLATQRPELRTQKFPKDVGYQARELIRFNCTASGSFDLERISTSMNGIQRAKIESCRILAARLAGNCDETVADFTLLDHGVFADKGGFKRISQEFDGTLDDVLQQFNEAIWGPSAA